MFWLLARGFVSRTPEMATVSMVVSLNPTKGTLRPEVATVCALSARSSTPREA